MAEMAVDGKVKRVGVISVHPWASLAPPWKLYFALPSSGWSLALIGNASAHKFGAKTGSPGRGIFDKETRRKPLAFAGDAAAMAIGGWFGTCSRRWLVGGLLERSRGRAISSEDLTAKALKIAPLRECHGSRTDRRAGVPVARPSLGYGPPHQEESKEALRMDSSAAVNRWTTTMGAPHVGHCQDVGPGVGVAPAAEVLGAQPKISRQIARRAVRQRLARKPKWRIRTNPLGRTCKKKRRRNSMAARVITRCLPPWT